MKELSIEEKAKAYDEALKVLHKYDGVNIMFSQSLKEEMFPELREESDDEKIRTKLLNLLKELLELGGVAQDTWSMNDCEQFIDWLEAQGEQKPLGFNIGDEITVNGQICKVVAVEQKPADKVEHKFEIGDCVVYDHRPYQVVELPKEGYINLGLRGNGKIEFAPSTYCRPWTIQDAKEGDVLATKAGGIFIYKELLYDKPFAYCGVDKFGVFKDCNCGDGLDWTPYLSDVTLATKEQRDLLFQKMKEAGYEWDVEKKELKKIEQKQDVNIQINPSEYINDMGGNGCYLKNTTQNHAWSEEDEDYYNAIIAKLEVTQDDALLTDNQIKFLKSLRPQSQWRPSDEQMEALSKAIAFVFDSNSDVKHSLESLYNELKKL